MEHTLVLKQWRDENTRILFTGNCDQYKIHFPLFLFHALLFKKVLYAIDARFCYGAKDWYA